MLTKIGSNAEPVAGQGPYLWIGLLKDITIVRSVTSTARFGLICATRSRARLGGFLGRGP